VCCRKRAPRGSRLVVDPGDGPPRAGARLIDPDAPRGIEAAADRARRYTHPEPAGKAEILCGATIRPIPPTCARVRAKPWLALGLFCGRLCWSRVATLSGRSVSDCARELTAGNADLGEVLVLPPAHTHGHRALQLSSGRGSRPGLAPGARHREASGSIGPASMCNRADCRWRRVLGAGGPRPTWTTHIPLASG